MSHKAYRVNTRNQPKLANLVKAVEPKIQPPKNPKTVALSHIPCESSCSTNNSKPYKHFLVKNITSYSNYL